MFKLPLVALLLFAQAPADTPETVFSTYRVKKGREADFQRVHAATWNAYVKHNLVLPSPHTVVKGKEQSGAPFVVEILTWKDHEAPDHVPADVKGLWTELESLCKKRDGHPGIEFIEMEIVKEN